jgi:hypothetical protein
MTDLLQILGALAVLGAFLATQLGRLHPRAVPYLVVNALGAGLLAVLALLGRDWGFLLLEGVWSSVSVASLVARRRHGLTPGATLRSHGARPTHGLGARPYR